MKKMTQDDLPVTKKELKEVLKEYPTKADLKQELSQYATKEDLKNELSKYATKKELKKELKIALENYPTKDELSDRLEKSFAAFRKENDHQFALMREEMHTTISQFTNRILTAIDPLLRELETRQQDRELAAAQMRNFEERLTKLEHS